MGLFQLHLTGPDELQGAAKDFLDAIGNRKVFAFSAPMGTGKTTFINALLHAMGIEHTEGSPTYSLVNVYDSPMYGKVYHMDVYRLNSELEAFDIGIEEMLYEGAICFIEWPEKISGLLPENTVFVELVKNSDGTRLLSCDL
jgi:tRNA threonylcarbamoyladenosine biosynthesis protein TsaE